MTKIHMFAFPKPHSWTIITISVVKCIALVLKCKFLGQYHFRGVWSFCRDIWLPDFTFQLLSFETRVNRREFGQKIWPKYRQELNQHPWKSIYQFFFDDIDEFELSLFIFLFLSSATLRGDDSHCRVPCAQQWLHFWHPLVLTIQIILCNYNIQHTFGEANFDCGLKRYTRRKRGLLSEKFAHPWYSTTIKN